MGSRRDIGREVVMGRDRWQSGGREIGTPVSWILA